MSSLVNNKINSMRYQQQVDQTQKHDFMQPIYQKIAKLKRNLSQYEDKMQQIHHDQNHQNYQKQIDSFNKQINLHDKKSFVKSKSHARLSLNSINNQLTINRLDLIGKERAKLLKVAKNNVQNLQNRERSTPMKASFAKSQNNFKNSAFKMSTRTFSCVNLYKQKDKLTNKKNYQIKNSQETKQYQSQPRIQTPQIMDEQKIINKKQIKKQYQIGKAQRKISRMLKFLDKNELKLQLNKQNKDKLSIHNQIKVQKLQQPDAPNQIDYYESLDQSDQFANQVQFQKLKHQKQTLEEHVKFKPIGSAKHLKRISHRSSHQGNKDPILQDQAKTIVIESNLSNYNNQKKQKINYLQKGNRMREVLQKKLLKGKSNKEEQLIYVHDYDQWVPAKLLQQNRKQVEKYLKFLLGQRKQIKHKKINLADVDIVYL